MDVALLRDGLARWEGQCDLVVVEGSGGLMSPITAHSGHMIGFGNSLLAGEPYPSAPFARPTTQSGNRLPHSDRPMMALGKSLLAGGPLSLRTV